MTPLPSPTSPLSPISPSFLYPLDPSTTIERPTPHLQVVTAFPVDCLLRQPSLSHTSSPSRTEHFTTLKHRRNASSMSSLYISPATEAILNQPLTSLPTPLTPRALSPVGPPIPSPRGVDGRQSRMNLRSPLPRPLRSPILERILELPLRPSANNTPPAYRISFETPQRSPSAASNFIHKSEESHSHWRPWTPIHAHPPAISFPPSRSHSPQSHSRSIIRRVPSNPRSSSTRKRPHSPPPHYHITVVPSVASTLSSSQAPTDANLPAYQHALSHLRTTLVPLISVTTGLPHPEFPRSLLQYHLLTHEQLDSLARWYHQTDPATEESWLYPAWIPPYTRKAARRASISGASHEGDPAASNISLTTKRRRWGRFMGLRGCESPVGLEGEEQEHESMVERMEREWRSAMERAREEEVLREKGWRGRW